MKIGQVVNITPNVNEIKIVYSQPLADDMGGNVDFLDLSFEMTKEMTLTAKVLDITSDGVVECEMLGFNAHIHFDKEFFDFVFDNSLTVEYYRDLESMNAGDANFKRVESGHVYEYDTFSIRWSNISNYNWVEVDGEVMCQWKY